MLHKRGRIVLLSILFLGLSMVTFLYKPTEVTAYPEMSSDGYTCTPCHTAEFGEANGAYPPDGSITPTTPTGTTAPADTTAPAATGAPAITTLPQTGVEGLYLHYLAGTGLLAPGVALLASRRKTSIKP